MVSRVVDTDEGPVTLTESVWTEHDRALLVALLAEQRETCPSCGHPMSQCRDPDTAGRWSVFPSICQASRVREAQAENLAKEGKHRGTHLGTRLNGG